MNGDRTMTGDLPSFSHLSSLTVVGLLGGVASGKSLVARQFTDLGAGLLKGDEAGHEVLTWPDVKQAVLDRFGERVFDADGCVDRRKLAEVVFGPPPEGPRELVALERITHPRIGDLLRRQAAELARQGARIAVLDAPVMLKAGWDKLCNHLVFVDAPRELRYERARERSRSQGGWSQEEFAAREAAQEPVHVKRDRADLVIDNSGTPEATRSQVERLWQSLTCAADR
jgi:dephospho-CoA kinase